MTAVALSVPRAVAGAAFGDAVRFTGRAATGVAGRGAGFVFAAAGAAGRAAGALAIGRPVAASYSRPLIVIVFVDAIVC